MKVPLLGGSYEARYKDLDCERTVNWYVHKTISQDDKEKNEFSLYCSPGLVADIEISKRNLRGSFVANTVSDKRWFVVADNTLYELSAANVATSRGIMTDMAKGSTKVWMEVNGNRELMIMHQSASYIFDMSANTLTKITDSDFPSNPSSLAFADGYFLVTANGRVYFSNLNSGLVWTGSDVYTPTNRADSTKAVVSYNEQIFNYGEESIEIYYNDGATPFSRLPGATSFVGLVNANCLSVSQVGMFFLGRSREGIADVYFIADKIPQPISDPNIAWQLNQVPLDSAYTFLQKGKDGHLRFFISVPPLHTTFVLDTLTKVWTERQSQRPGNDSDGTIVQSVFRGNYPVNFNNRDYVCDIYSGKILREDYNVFTEDGITIRRLRITNTIENEQNYITGDSLEIDANSGEAALLYGQGSNPKMMLRVSPNGGYTWSSLADIELGRLGSYDTRVKINSLGTKRNWTFEFTVTDPVNVFFQSAIFHGTVSSS